MLKNERGSMIMAILLGFGCLAAAVALFDTFKASNIALGYVSDKVKIDPAVEFILMRLESCVALANPSQCPKADEFKTMMTLPVAAASPTTAVTLAPITLSKNEIMSQPGLVTSRATAIDESLSDFDVVIERQATLDDAVFASTRVSIRLSFTPKYRFISLAKGVVNKSLRVTLQSPVSFALILRSPSAPAISLGTGELTVIGGALMWKSSVSGLRPTDVIAAANVGKLSLDRTWTTSPHIDIQSPDDETSLGAFRVGGVAVSALPGAEDSFGSDAFWNQPLDYKYVYDSNGYPLPSSIANSAHTSTGQRRVNWDATASLAEIRSDATTYPTSSVMGSNNLEVTCERPINFQEGSMKTLVLMRKGANLTFDYNANGGANYACGMVFADAITFNIPAGRTVAWYGHLNATRIVVNGGSLVVVNPFSAATRPGDLPGPSNLTISDMMQMYMALGSSTAHNFFVPFTRHLSAFTGLTGYTTVDTKFTLAGAYRTWILAVDPPDLSDFLKGVGCVNGGTPACWNESVFLFTEETF